MSEFAVVSARRSRLAAAAERGDPRAAPALALAESPTRFLSTVQAWISFIGITIGAFGEAALSHKLEKPGGAPGPGAVPRGRWRWRSWCWRFTYVSLVLGELVPQRIGMSYPERIASIMARPIGCCRGSRRAGVVPVGLDRPIVRVMGLHRATPDEVTHEDIKGMMEQRRRRGGVQGGAGDGDGGAAAGGAEGEGADGAAGRHRVAGRGRPAAARAGGGGDELPLAVPGVPRRAGRRGGDPAREGRAEARAISER